MQNKRIRSATLILAFFLVTFLAACGSSSETVAEPQSDKQTEDGDAVISTWQYKMTVVSNFGKSDWLQENGTVIFDGTFTLFPTGAIESHEGKVTVSGTYRCREAFSDPPRVLEGTLSGEHPFVVEGVLIRPEDYVGFGVWPSEPLTDDDEESQYALISIPKVSDRTPVSVSFGRENCTSSDFTPVIAEGVSFGEVPYFNLEEYGKRFVVMLDPQNEHIEPIELNDAGSKVLSKAELCVAPLGLCP